MASERVSTVWPLLLRILAILGLIGLPVHLYGAPSSATAAPATAGVAWHQDDPALNLVGGAAHDYSNMAGASRAPTPISTGPRWVWGKLSDSPQGYCSTVDPRLSFTYKGRKLQVRFDARGFAAVNLSVVWSDLGAKVQNEYKGSPPGPTSIWSGPPIVLTHVYLAAPTVTYISWDAYSAKTDKWCYGDAHLVFPTPTGHLPDLVVRQLSTPPHSVSRGGKFQVTTTTTNIGAAGAGASTLLFTLVSIPDYKQQKVGSQAVSALAPGKSVTTTTTLVVPVTTLPKQYVLVACANSGYVVAESNERNDCRVSPTPVKVS